MKSFYTVILISLGLLAKTETSWSQTANVVSFNIKYDNTADTINNWNDRKPHLAKLIQHYDSDIVGIQEGLHHQVAYLNNTLADHSYVGVGRDDAKEKGEYSAIFYNTRKFKVLKTNTFWLSETPEKVSVGWDASMERICTYALFENRASKKKIWVFNTHFDHRGMQARVNSAQLIYKKIREINTSNLPVILMGDLNLTPETEPIQYLKKNLTDAKEVTRKPFYGPVGTFNGFDQGRIMKNRIDYFFVKDVEVLSYSHIDDRMPNNKHISDHLPVLMTISY